MKRSFLLGCLLLICLAINAQETAKNQIEMLEHSVFVTAGANLNGGIEVSLGSEYFFNTNHTTSIYGLIDYHTAHGDDFERVFHFTKKAMAEIGARYYIPAVKSRFYPYIGLAATFGMQMIEKWGYDISRSESAGYLFGGVGTIGLEYMLARNVAVEAVARIKYTDFDDDPYFIIGGGVKFYF